MLKYVFFLVFSLVTIPFYAQTTIAHQSFETNGDNWDFTLSTPPCSLDGVSWNYQESLENMDPSDGNQFWGVQDLNGSCAGNDFESLNFTSIDISEFRNVTLNFDYNAFELDNGDDIKFEIFLNEISQGEVILFEGNSNSSTNGWKTATIHIPNTSSKIRLIISIKQNGQDDYIGIDNVKLTGTQISYCAELIISEYVEGTSSGTSYRNNYIEIYNPTDQDIDLTEYDLTKYTNDNLDPTGSIPLTGIISGYDTFLIEDTTENLGIDADISSGSSVMDFNGNDKIVLRKNEETIDIIGIIGDNINFAEDITLRRKSFVQSPNNQYNENEWDTYGLEDLSNLKSHLSYCSGTIPEIEVLGNLNNISDGSLITNANNNTYFGSIEPSFENGISKSFTIKNIGIGILNIDEINILGTNASDFILIDNSVSNISPNDSIQFEVNFKPSAMGIRTAMLSISNNDASENPFNFILKGEGTGESSSPLMITQYYEGDGNNKWLEVTNISDSPTQNNEYFLALYRNGDASNPIGRKPTIKKTIPVLNPGETLKYRASLNVDSPEYAIDGNEIKTNICTFDGNDIIIISTTDDASCWINKVDIIGNNSYWGDSKSFVRKYGCEGVEPSTGFNVEDWIFYEISDINNANIGFNLRIGEHYVGSTSYNSDNSWDNGLPDLRRSAIIDHNYNTLTYGNLEVCNLTITANTTLEVGSENHISIKNDLTVNGTLEVLHQGSVFMINDSGTVINNGTTNIHKTTTIVKPYDYTYWSSPVKNETLSKVFSASPQNSFYTFETPNYIDADNDSNDDDENAWQSANGLMEIGKGYTAMAPNTSPFINTQSIIFSGEINNGEIDVSIELSGDNSNDE
ncbi:MAG: choice-of-anchor D domain-containing protein, partial [Candidatus Cloacimonetes bacterium]|nr:choice-of-anchor D domain-containing protein [Candidatus Cloacimonadota bacterium]